MKKGNKGITLVALVVTIIVLLILAGVVIRLIIGNKGIFNRAEDAKNKYIVSVENERKELNELYKELGIEEIPENTEENPPKIGTEVALKKEWGEQTVKYTNTNNGEDVNELTKVATVYAVLIEGGDIVPIPNNFWYVGGTLDNGVIISDNEEDKYDGVTDKTKYEHTRNLKGNQFVWIPCNVEEYKKCDTWNGTKQTNTKLGSNWWDTTTPKSELTQIEKYGGFYVARYEAGLASTIPEFTEQQVHNNRNNQIYNKEGVPQSKAGIAPWNFIDWNTSKKNAESMYNNEYVSSGLITGTQYDVILNKMVSKKAINSSELINSNTWGNYRNTVLTYTGRLSKAFHSSDNWYIPAFSKKVTENGKTGNYTSDNTYGDLLTTGASSETEKYHIFDLAGNVWEWTEETSFMGGNVSIQYRVLRGGSCIIASNVYPACFRHYQTVDNTNPTFGFRTVLYIK